MTKKTTGPVPVKVRPLTEHQVKNNGRDIVIYNDGPQIDETSEKALKTAIKNVLGMHSEDDSGAVFGHGWIQLIQ